MIRYLILTRTSQQAGAEKIIGVLSDGLVARGFEVSLISLSQLGTLRGAKTFVKTLFFKKFDVLHSHLFLPGVLARLVQSAAFRLICKERRVWMHTVHYGSYEGQTWPRLKEFIDRALVFKNADRLIAVSSSVKDWLQRLHVSRSSVLTIQNCLKFESPSEISARVTVDQSVKTIITVSMLRREKGLHHLISAMARLKNTRSAVRLRIAGEGPERANLEAMILNLGLNESVELCGYQEDRATFLASGDIFASTSLAESFGLSILEALRAGIPIVASNAGEIPALLKNGNFGRVVDHGPDFAERFAKAILETLSDLPLAKQKSFLGADHHRASLSPDLLIADYAAEAERLLRPAVCMVSPIVTHATGGIQKQIWLQSRELARRGYRVYILQKEDPLLWRVIDRWPHVEFLQTPHLPTYLPANAGFFARLDGLLFIFFGFLQIFKIRNRLRVIHAHQLYSPSVVGWLAKTILKKPFVVKVTASGAYGEMNELKKLPFWKFRQRAFKDIDRVIVLSDQMKTEMRQMGFVENQISLIPNSVETPPMPASAEQPPSLAKEPLRILFTGRLSREKSLETLLMAGQQLALNGQPIEIHLVGGTYGGRDSSIKLREIANQKIENLEILFHEPQSDISEFYKMAHVFVLPSLSEGMSNALLEAMAYSLPCVVSAIGANTFVITDGVDGLTFETTNADDLARQLSRLMPGCLVNDLLRARLGAAARDTVQRRFSVVSIGERLTQLYRELEST